MLTTRIRIASEAAFVYSRRFASNRSLKDGKRFIQTIPIVNSGPDFYSGLNYSMTSKGSFDGKRKTGADRWSKHSLGSLGAFGDDVGRPETPAPAPVVRRSRASRFSNKSLKDTKETKPIVTETKAARDASEITIENNIPKSTVGFSVDANPVQAKKSEVDTEAKPKKRRALKPRKALITLSPGAVKHLKDLLNQPNPQMIRIGVQNRGCSGLTYLLEYVTEAGKFDELVEQDDVKVLIDSKALFSIVGSEMDWLDDKLSSRFIFKNPNSKGTCGCGESFMV